MKPLSFLVIVFFGLTAFAGGGGGPYQSILQYPEGYFENLYSSNGFSNPQTTMTAAGGFGLADNNGRRSGGGGLAGSFNSINGSDRISSSFGQGGFFIGRSFGTNWLKFFADLKFDFGAARLKVETTSGINAERSISYFSPAPSVGIQLRVLPFISVAVSADYVSYYKFSDSTQGDNLGLSPLPDNHIRTNAYLVFGKP